jgi:glucokinase
MVVRVPRWIPGQARDDNPGMKACVDIGGTKVAVSLAQGRELAFRRTEPTTRDGRLAQQVLRMIQETCTAAGTGTVDAVGVSSCGPFVMKEGFAELAAPNICPGESVPLEAALRRVFANVRVENDAVAALEAERRWGALQGFDHCAYVTWSTGIGVGLCVDGRVLRGRNGNAGHAGHMFVSDDAQALCGCGNRGDVESLVAGSAAPRRFGMDMAQALPTQASELCRLLGRMLHNLVVTLDLQAIALGGSVFWHHQDMLLPRLQAQSGGGPRSLVDGVQLVPAGLGERVGDYAALALVA